MIKPAVLYHASKNRDIEVFEPRNESVRDPNEGPVIFATPSRAMASVFIVPTDDSWTASGGFSWSEQGKNNEVIYFVCSDENRFRKLDKGGAIYFLPAETFEFDPEKGLGEMEWVSTVSVKPISRDIIESGLGEMIKNRVQVYFVNSAVFQDIKQAPDHGRTILSALVSENMKLGKNTQSLK